MKQKYVLRSALALTAVSLLALVPGALATSSGPKVTVRIEGQSKTLLAAKSIQTEPGSITRGGATAGQCPSTSAQGALQDATHGKWAGTWYPSYQEYFITGIDGETPNSAKDYWEVLVNDVPSEVGACEQALKSGDRVLFAVVPDKGTDYPLGLTAPKSVKAGETFTVKIVAYNAKGKASPLKGAKVAFGGPARTVAGSSVTLIAHKTGTRTVTVSKSGYIRDEATITVTKG